MHRSHFLQFDEADDDDHDTVASVKQEPAQGAAAGRASMRAPTGSSRKRAHNGIIDKHALFGATSATAAVKAETASGAASMRPRAHQCPYCSYSCDCKSALTIHVRIHSGEKPFKVCPLPAC